MQNNILTSNLGIIRGIHQPMNENRKPLLEFAMAMVLEINHDLPQNLIKTLEGTLESYINGAISYKDAEHIFQTNFGNTLPVNKVCKILSVGPTPFQGLEDYPLEAQHILINKRTRPWSPKEDERLLAGIHKFGLHSWGTIASFVGNSRNKAQCSQRWSRGLDPMLTKSPWSAQEIEDLKAKVAKYGTKSWRKISSEMVSRSDVQCRYKYKLLTQKSEASANVSGQPSSTDAPVVSDPVKLNQGMPVPIIGPNVKSQSAVTDNLVPTGPAGINPIPVGSQPVVTESSQESGSVNVVKSPKNQKIVLPDINFLISGCPIASW